MLHSKKIKLLGKGVKTHKKAFKYIRREEIWDNLTYHDYHNTKKVKVSYPFELLVQILGNEVPEGVLKYRNKLE